jgi:HipA-like protein
MMATQATQLGVFDGDAHVGTIHDTDPISFEYTPEWLNFADRYPVATIALQGGRNDSPAVNAFFENLLPEGASGMRWRWSKKSPVFFRSSERWQAITLATWCFCLRESYPKRQNIRLPVGKRLRRYLQASHQREDLNGRGTAYQSPAHNVKPPSA